MRGQEISTAMWVLIAVFFTLFLGIVVYSYLSGILKITVT
jgi:hypothetical protein